MLQGGNGITRTITAGNGVFTNSPGGDVVLNAGLAGGPHAQNGKLSLQTGGVEQMSIDGSGNIDVEGTLSGALAPTSLVLPSYLKAALPVQAITGLIYVSDAAGASAHVGQVCFSDGTNWIDMSTNAPVA